MRRWISTLSVIIALTCAVPSRAQHGALDLVPADSALAAIVVRDLDGLLKKGDKFIEETGFRVPLRPSELFSQAVQFLGIRGGLDDRGSAAILLLRPERDGDNIGFGNLEELLAGSLPFSDLDKFAANFGFEAGQLKANRIGRGKAQGFGTHFYARNKNMILANHERTVERIVKSKTLGEEMSGKQRETFGKADILLHLSPKGIGRDWESILDEAAKEFLKSDDAADEKVLRDLRGAMGSLRYISGGVRLDDGLGLNLLAMFPKDGPAKEFLASLRTGTKASSLHGLPEGNILAA